MRLFGGGQAERLSCWLVALAPSSVRPQSCIESIDRGKSEAVQIVCCVLIC